MRPVTLTTTDASGGATTSGVFIPDRNTMAGFAVGFAVTVSGTVNYTVQHTFDDIVGGAYTAATATWFDHASVASETTNQDGNYAFPCAAIRLRQASGTGSCTMKIIQAG